MLRASFGLPLAFATLGLAGCLVTVTEDDDGIGGFGGEDVTVTSTSSTKATTTTATTATSTDATTVTSSSTGTACVGADGTGLGVSECDQVAGNLSECPSNGQQPLAGATCDRGFEIFTSGSWENLLTCLKNIPFSIPDLCDDPLATNNVAACTDKMYADACPNAVADQTCSDVANVVCGQEGGFDEASCKAGLVPFSEAGLNAYATCINESGTVSCADLNAHCLGQVISF